MKNFLLCVLLVGLAMGTAKAKDDDCASRLNPLDLLQSAHFDRVSSALLAPITEFLKETLHRPHRFWVAFDGIVSKEDAETLVSMSSIGSYVENGNSHFFFAGTFADVLRISTLPEEVQYISGLGAETLLRLTWEFTETNDAEMREVAAYFFWNHEIFDIQYSKNTMKLDIKVESLVTRDRPKKPDLGVRFKDLYFFPDGRIPNLNHVFMNENFPNILSVNGKIVPRAN